MRARRLSVIGGALGGLVGFLALAGGAVLVLRLLRATFRLVLTSAEVITTAGLADVSARRGDLTGMMERRSAEAEARRSRRAALALTALWVAWLVLPMYAGWVREAYAIAAVLWLAPAAPKAPGRPPPDPPPQS